MLCHCNPPISLTLSIIFFGSIPRKEQAASHAKNKACRKYKSSFQRAANIESFAFCGRPAWTSHLPAVFLNFGKKRLKPIAWCTPLFYIQNAVLKF